MEASLSNNRRAGLAGAVVAVLWVAMMVIAPIALGDDPTRAGSKALDLAAVIKAGEPQPLGTHYAALGTPKGAPSAVPTPKPTPKPTPALTASQRNAIAKAQDYLSYTSFSRSGLINQLVYEGFTKTVSTFAVDSLKVDWNEQSYLKAKDYLGYTSFSLPSLIDQLVYEGFTKAQAKYGATKAYGG